MSAFSDWNGPGCNQGPSLPQIRTLEQLILDVGALSQRITAIANELELHEGKQVITPTNPAHAQGTTPWAQTTDISALDNTVRTKYVGGTFDPGGAPTKGALQVQIDNLTSPTNSTSIQNQIADHNTPSQVVTYLKNKHQDIWNIFATIFDQQPSDVIVPQNFKSQITTLINGMAAHVATALLSVDRIERQGGTGFIELLNDIKAKAATFAGAINTEIIKCGSYIDFDKWANVQAQLVPNIESSTGHPVMLLGTMSTDFDSNYNVISETIQKIKTARAYIKYIDDKPWNAVIDMTCTVSPLDNEISGTILGVASKTNNREFITFGLYRATTFSGTSKIYLGCSTSDNFSTTNPSAGYMQFYVSGYNFISLRPEDVSNSPVTPIAETTLYADQGVLIDSLTVNKIYCDNYFDQQGHPLMIVDEDASLINIGSYAESNAATKELALYSTDRPIVRDEHGANHAVAYLEDLISSIVWQRTITMLAESWSELALDDGTPNPAIFAVYFDTDDNVIGHSQSASAAYSMPGFYVFNPDEPTPRAHLFGYAGTWKVKPDASITVDYTIEIALVRDSGQPETPLADGHSGDVLPGIGLQSEINAGSVTGIPFDQIVADLNGVNGTTLVGVNAAGDEVFAVVQRIALGPNGTTVLLVRGIPVSDAQLSWTTPAYSFMNDAGKWLPLQVIQLPHTQDDYVSDLAYQWQGYHKNEGSSIGFGPAYIVWYAQHEREIYGGDPWSFVSLYLENYRTASEQDAIDSQIIALSTAQADYAEYASVIPNPVQGNLSQGAIIPNPTFIQHKPFVGQSVFSGGSFTDAPIYWHWLVDGGDFTPITANYAANEPLPIVGETASIPLASIATGGATLDVNDILVSNINQNFARVVLIGPDNVNVTGVAISPQQQVQSSLTAAPDHQFRNVIIRTWSGAKPSLPATGNTNFVYTLKWCMDTRQLYIDNGTENYLIDQFKWVDLVGRQLVNDVRYTPQANGNLYIYKDSLTLNNPNNQVSSTIGHAVENSTASDTTSSMVGGISDQVNPDVGPSISGLTAYFINYTGPVNGVQINSPRMSSLENAVTYKEAFNNTPVITSVNMIFPVDERLEFTYSYVEPWHSTGNTGVIDGPKLHSDYRTYNGVTYYTVEFESMGPTSQTRRISSSRISRLEAMIPQPPSTPGTYQLRCNVLNPPAITTYFWTIV